jgi:hypothetical protein
MWRDGGVCFLVNIPCRNCAISKWPQRIYES